eukprot:1354022-Alexandrium_andersonii.AAC.1
MASAREAPGTLAALPTSLATARRMFADRPPDESSEAPRGLLGEPPPLALVLSVLPEDAFRNFG